MMKQQWDKLTAKVDSMSLRERVLIFLAAAFLLVAIVNSLFLDPLLAQQKNLSGQVIQQQEKIKEKQAETEALLQAQQDDSNSPLRRRLADARRQLAEGDAWLQSNRERLVQPERMPDLLEQVLRKNSRLQLISLQTLPATPLIEKSANAGGNGPTAVPEESGVELEKQIYKHGVKITVKGGYAALMQYLVQLEALPAKMFWGMAEMKVEKYPDTELTLTLYTLSLDKTWLQI
jgi:MSHA biogenesis protein MshJ